MNETHTFFSLLDALRHDLLRVSLPAFAPELAVCATIVVMLVARIPTIGRRMNSFWVAMPGTLVALFLAAPWHHLQPTAADAQVRTHQLLGSQIFDGLLVYDELTVYFRGVLLLFALLFFFFTRISGIPDREDSADFYTLVLGATLGMCLMASANHLLMVFLGVEMASVPSYALAGFLKGRRTSGEAALKYAVYGAGAAGVMLYGISLVAGALGSVHLPTMAVQLAQLSPEAFAARQLVLMSGGLMIGVGLAFKLSAVPFHFWAPDVFEGACAEVGAFLSVASKAAALALLLRVALGLSHVPGASAHAAVVDLPGVESAAAATTPNVTFVSASSAPHAAAPHAADSAARSQTPLDRSRDYIAQLIALVAAVTCTFGNLAAYGQTNIKRLLAYSTIAHAGYMMMPAAAAVALVGKNPASAREAVSSICFYVGIYLFMNLGAFAVVAFLRNVLRSERIEDYAGLIRRSPGIVILFSAMLLSLVGLPPLAGFAAKMLAFYALTAAEMYLLLFVGGLNTAISLFYYLRVIRTMTLDPEPADRAPIAFSLISSEGVFATLVTLPVIVLGIWWDPLHRLAQAAAGRLF